MSDEKPELVDKQVLAMLEDAIGDSLKKIVDLYLSDVPLTLNEMRTALKNGDLVTVRRLAHSLKSSSANLGAMQTSAVAAELEQYIDADNTDQTQVLGMIDQIANTFDQTRSIYTAL